MLVVFCYILAAALFPVPLVSLKHSNNSFVKRSLRFRRYAIEGSFWGVGNITYRITQPSTSLSLVDQKHVFRKAFETWEEHTNLSFKYEESGEVHIDIIFAKLFHGDGEPFDGPGKVLAHAYFPRYGGDLHFDDDEFWSLDKSGPGVDLYAVAVHEIGHALGLKHSHEPEAIMAPFYQTYTGEKLHLNQDDLSAIGRLYGPSGVVSKGKSIRGTRPNICKITNIDGITKVSNGSLYVFKGQFFWEISLRDGIEHTNPKLIKQFWSIDGPIDAVVTNNAGITYIFKDNLYYVLSPKGVILEGYPKLIEKGLQDMPSKIDAAFIWHHDNQPYFVKRNMYWKYSRYGMPASWPRSISTLFRTKAPSRIDAALQLDHNSTFIFSGKYYWKLSGYREMKVLEGYPRLTSEYWFNCDGREHSEK